jgi:hypothetical protein
MELQLSDSERQVVSQRIRAQIQERSARYRQQLVARLVSCGDPDWILSVFDEQG